MVRFNSKSLFAVSLLTLLAACGKNATPAGGTAVSGATSIASQGSIPSLPVGIVVSSGSGASAPSCVRGIQADPSWKSKTSQEILAWLATYGVAAIQPDLSQEYLAEFAAEFERIPEIFRKRVFAAGGTIHLLQGQGVSEDPSWPAQISDTFDGRSWATVPGAGGMPYLSAYGADASPTRFVINRLYEGHGSVNLVIHEFGHALDAITQHDGFSGTPAWVAFTQSDTAFRGMIGSLCGTYCTEHTEESFAESFAVYNSCDSMRKWFVQKAPAAAAWIGNLSASLGQPALTAPLGSPTAL